MEDEQAVQVVENVEKDRLRDLDIVPERVSLPSFCCIRDCGKEPSTITYEAGEGDILIFAFCNEHRNEGVA